MNSDRTEKSKVVPEVKCIRILDRKEKKKKKKKISNPDKQGRRAGKEMQCNR